MSKLYVVILVVAIIWLIYKAKTKKNKAVPFIVSPWQPPWQSSSAMSELASLLALSEGSVQKPEVKKKKPRKQFGARVRNMIASNQEWKCYICSKSLPPDYHLDHKVPLVEGGADQPYNLGACCVTCHSRKTYMEGIKNGF